MAAQTWTYSGDPQASVLDKVRFLVGDTDSDDRQIADEEILFCIAESASYWSAAAMACRTLAGRYARSVSRSVGDLSLNAETKAQHYHDLAAQYESMAGEAGFSVFALSSPYAGGISVDDRDNQIANSDRVDPMAEVGNMDYPGTSRGQQYDRGDWRWR